VVAGNGTEPTRATGRERAWRACVWGDQPRGVERSGRRVGRRTNQPRRRDLQGPSGHPGLTDGLARPAGTV